MSHSVRSSIVEQQGRSLLTNGSSILTRSATPLLLLLHGFCSPTLVSQSSIPVNRGCGAQCVRHPIWGTWHLRHLASSANYAFLVDLGTAGVSQGVSRVRHSRPGRQAL